jgi:hypothetical protein
MYGDDAWRFGAIVGLVLVLLASRCALRPAT